MRREQGMKGITLKCRNISTISHSRKKDKIDNKDNRMSILTDDNSAIVMDKKHVKVARECVCTHEKITVQKLHEGKSLQYQQGNQGQKRQRKPE